MRICSLLPSATEICYALGLAEELVAVTHECDFPADALRKPQVTRSRIPAGLPGAAIDRLVRTQLSDAGTLYRLDAELLENLAPDLILAQELCTVCAVSYETVLRIAARLPSRPRVINLEPRSLEGILDSIRLVGLVAGVPKRGDALAEVLEERLAQVRRLTAGVRRTKVACLEWVDPPYCAGHWIPELVDIAGGEDALGAVREPSRPVAWNQIIEYTPDVIVVMCCGFSAERSMGEWLTRGRPFLTQRGSHLKPRVFAVDGSSYFSRPGPRIAESAEILASILHPDLFPEPDPAAVRHIADQ